MLLKFRFQGAGVRIFECTGGLEGFQDKKKVAKQDDTYIYIYSA